MKRTNPFAVQPSVNALRWSTLAVAWSSLAVGLTAQDWRMSILNGRAYQAAAFDAARGRVVMFSGLMGYSTYPRDTWEYHGGQWTPSSPIVMPGGRGNAAMAFDSLRNRIVMYGGNTAGGYFGDTWEYDGTNWQLIATGVAPLPRAGHTLAFDAARGRMVLFGGVTSGPPMSSSPTILGDTWEYTAAGWVQRHPTASPTPRGGHAMTFDAARARTVLFAGVNASGYLADTWEFDGSTWLQVATANAPQARSEHRLVFDGARNRTVLFAGRNTNLNPQWLGDTWEYDGVNWTAIATPTSPPARWDHVLAYDSVRGRTVAYGGSAPTALALDDTWEYDGVNWTQVGPNRQLPPLGDGMMAHDTARARTVQFTGFPQLNDTWEYDGSSWTRHVTAASPSPRTFAAFAYDAVRRRSVLFGGSDLNQLFVETWEYDGVNWLQAAPSSSPPGRNFPAMVFDLARRRMVLFGGNNFADTWEYDGVNWTQALPAHHPSGRYRHNMAYDAARGRTVLFGGWDGNPTGQLGDTWEYDGIDWAQRAVSGPMARMDHAMTYDPLHGRTILFGGASSQALNWLDDTWEYDGSGWRQLAVASRPDGRAGAALAYDLGRARAVMFGGPVNDTWELLPSSMPTWTRYGLGCAGGSGTPALDAAPAALPSLGSTFTLQLTALSGPTFLLFGFDLVQWNGLALPVDFDASRPHCNLWIGPAPGAGLLLLPIGGAAGLGLSIPANPALAGTVLGTQALVLDGSVPAGFALTNGGVLIVH
jgi:hypothetical protein